jgi:hypothetical protein
MGFAASVSSARARADERATSAKDRKNEGCRVRPWRWRGRRGRKPANLCSAKRTHKDVMGHTIAHGILTLLSCSVQRRLGAELSTLRVDRRTTVGARRVSFGASSSGWKEVGRGRWVETLSQKKTRMTQPNSIMVGEKRTYTGAARVSHVLEHRRVIK